MLKHFVSSAIKYILPHRCALCSKLSDSCGGLCAPCFTKLNFITSPFCNICGFPFEFAIEGQISCAGCISSPPQCDLSRSLFKFDNSSKNLIHAFKYNDKTMYAKIFAKLLYSRYKNDISDIDMIIPVPMNKFKRVFRNYNPAQILAHELTKLTQKPTQNNVLKKTKWTKSQIYLNKIQRSKNLKNSIIIINKDILKKKTILLVDDVKTTGATSNICASLLKQAGAKTVKLITISIA